MSSSIDDAKPVAGEPTAAGAAAAAAATGGSPAGGAVGNTEAGPSSDGSGPSVSNPRHEIRLSGEPQSLIADARALITAAWRIDRARFLLQIFFLFFTGVIGGFNLLLLIPIVNAVANPEGTLQVPVVGEVAVSSVPLWLLLAVFVALAAVQALIQRASAINSAQFQPRIVDELRQQAFEAILHAKWEFVLQRRRSDIISIVTVGAARCGLAFQQLMQGSVNLVLAIVTAAVALFVSPAVGAIALVGVLALGAIQLLAIRPAHRLGRQFGEKSRGLQAVMQDSMDSLRLVRAHNAAGVWAEQLMQAFTDTREVQVANARRTGTAQAFSSVALAAAAALLVLVSVQLEVPPVSIVVILVLVARLARLAQQLANIASQLANSLPAVSDIAALTNEAREAVEVPAAAGGGERQLTAAAPDTPNDEAVPLLEFVDVSYTYPNSENGIRGVSFAVPRGQITALTGPSGTGKSTCADLALGLLEPAQGQIRVDGVPLTRADLPWWREHVAYVPQETVLIPASLRENLVWSVPREVSDAECWAALDQASADFARELPDGLDTLLGDRGIRLSGGERQRVAIARALLRRPTLIVMDEATSSLDDETEGAVVAMVRSLAPTVTVLTIAHRQTTVRAAQEVVRVHPGPTPRLTG